MKDHQLDCYAEHVHEHPACCSFSCWCTNTLPEELCRLEDLSPGEYFVAPWDEKQYLLLYVTPSAGWVEVVKEKEFEVPDKKTGLKRHIKTKIKENEPWSRRTVVKKLPK